MASTYSSNLNIEIITSGEQAGTWGDTTNQNWKRVEESRTYATQDLGGSASVDWTLGDTTDAYVTADIGSNPSSGRAAFVKFTNAHGSGTTIDINGNSNTDFPNRVFFAYNNSGATLTFSGGSGTNFALQNGASAAIYSNGTLADNVLSTLQVGGNPGGTAGLILAGGSITDVSGAISFNNENLSTTGTLGCGVLTAATGSTVGNLTLANGSITDSSGNITFNNENLVTTGTLGCGVLTAATGSAVGNLTLANGSITDSSGAISFGNENLSTTGTLGAGVITAATGSSFGNITIANGSITDSSGAISFGNENLSTTGTLGAGVVTAATGSSFGNVTIANGSITDSSGAISFGNENLTTTGTLGAGATTLGGNLDLGDNNILNTGYIHLDQISASDASVGVELYFNGNTGSNVIKLDDGKADALSVQVGSSTDLIVFDTTLTNAITVSAALDVTEDLDVDNININGNAISSTNSNGVITIEPNGTGNINLVTDTVRLGSDGENCFITTNGAGSLRLNTNGGSNSGYIRILDGVNRNINIEPNGSGDIRLFEDGGSGDLTLSDNDISGVGTITASSFSGTATTATTATNVTVADESSDTTCFPLFATAATGDLPPKTGSNLTFNSNTGALTATSFVGDLTGNASGSSGSCTGNSATATLASTVTVTDSSANTDFPVAFHNESNALLDDTGAFTYNPSSGLLTLNQIDSKGKAGSRNFVAGAGAGNALEAGATDNIIIGDGAGNAQTTADNNILIGSDAGGGSAGITTAEKTILIGSDTGLKHSTTELNGEDVGIGYNALKSVGGYFNVAIGTSALEGNPSYTPSGGDYDQVRQNVSIGYQSMQYTGVGSMSNAIQNNVAIGHRSLRGENIGGLNGATNNVAVGMLSLEDIQTGSNNSCLGSESGKSITTGNNNVAIGSEAGDVITTGSANVLIGTSVDASSNSASNQIAIGHNITGVGNKVCFGKSGNVLSADYTGTGTTTWSASSDINIKKNIEPESIGLSLINKLNPVQFNFKSVDDLSDKEDMYVDYVSSKSSKRCHGFIAQEVEEAAQSVGIDSLDGLYVDAKGVYQFGATAFIQPMVKSIQELSSKIDSLESRLAALE